MIYFNVNHISDVTSAFHIVKHKPLYVMFIIEFKTRKLLGNVGIGPCCDIAFKKVGLNKCHNNCLTYYLHIFQSIYSKALVCLAT